MAQERENPIYWDQNATKWNLTLIFSLVVVVLGFIMEVNGSGGFLLVILGAVMAAYSWLTTPRQFLLYRDSMVVVYGIPRTRVISLAEISHVELLALPFGERLRVRMMSGSRMMLMMRDPGAFRAHLEDALAQYHGEQSGAAYAAGTLVDRGDEGEFDTDIDSEYGTEYTEHGTADDPVSESEIEAEVTAEAEPQAENVNSGSYAEEAPDPSEPAETSPVDEDVYTGRVEPAPSTSGSYTETPEPDFSGEGRPVYGADVEFETSPNSEEDDSSQRPPSPY